MSRDYPDWVDPVKAAQSRREVHASIPLARLERLADLLADSEGEAGFHLAFSFDAQGQVCVRVQVAAEVTLICQRTLKPFRFAATGESLVGIVSNEQAEQSLPQDYEPMLCPDNRLRLADLVQEELILALPLVPTAPNTVPLAPEEQPERQRPFAALAELKRKS